MSFDQSKIGVVTASTQLFRSVGGTVGTAVLGAVFNNALAKNSQPLADTPYGQAAATHGLKVTDPNVIEGLLSPQGQAKVQQSMAHLPQAAHAAAQSMFSDFLAQAKAAFSTSIAHLFLISAMVACVALVTTLFLKEIPLKSAKPKRDSATAAGDELAVELGQSEGKDEPVLVH